MIINALEIRYRALEGTNTRTRRLAYISAIIKIIGTTDVSRIGILTRLLDWSESNRRFLHDFWADSGEVTQTSSNSSAHRYLDLVVGLRLATQTAGIFRLTRMGLVLYALIRECSRSNPFFLSDAEEIFFLYWLLRIDADPLLTVIDILLERPDARLAYIQERYQNNLIQRLSTKLSLSKDELVQRDLLDRKYFIQDKWKSPKRYVEHIVPPRLNWLLDIEFFEPGLFRHHQFHFMKSGEEFLSKLPTLGDTNLHDVSDHWLDTEFWHAAGSFIDKPNQLRLWDETNPQAEIELYVSRYLERAFAAFRHTMVPKISLTQAIIYIGISLLANERIVLSPSSLSKWLETPKVFSNRQYEVRYSPRENERYLIARSV